jgi:hypothetical protein
MILVLHLIIGILLSLNPYNGVSANYGFVQPLPVANLGLFIFFWIYIAITLLAYYRVCFMDPGFVGTKQCSTVTGGLSTDVQSWSIRKPQSRVLESPRCCSIHLSPSLCLRLPTRILCFSMVYVATATHSRSGTFRLCSLSSHVLVVAVAHPALLFVQPLCPAL